jgi:hypothetical protein
MGDAVLAAEVARYFAGSDKLRLKDFIKIQEYLLKPPNWLNLIEFIERGYISFVQKNYKASFMSALKKGKSPSQTVVNYATLVWAKK